MSEVQRSATPVQKTSDQSQIVKVIKERMLGRRLTVNLPGLDDHYGEIISVTDKGVLVRFDAFIPPAGTIVLSGFFAEQYTEVEIKILESLKPSVFFCRPSFIRVCSQRRMETRYEVTDPEAIHASRIRISSHELEYDGAKLPAVYKDILDSYNNKLSNLGDKVTVAPFESLEGIMGEIYRTGNTLYIADCREDLPAAEERNEELIDLAEFHGDACCNELIAMQQEGNIGRIICPILGPGSGKSYLPVGYIEVLSRAPLDFTALMEVKRRSLEINDCLRDSSILEIRTKQRILDISPSGMRLEINDDKAIEAILRRTTLTLDVVIKDQEPITVLGWIRSARKMPDGTLQVGLKIQGEGSRQEQMYRYAEYVKSQG